MLGVGAVVDVANPAPGQESTGVSSLNVTIGPYMVMYKHIQFKYQYAVHVRIKYKIRTCGMCG